MSERIAHSPGAVLDNLERDVDAAAERMERMAAKVREPGFDNWDVFPDNPPGRGRSLSEVLAAGCPKCGGPVHAEAAFSSLLETILLRFAPISASEQEELERTFEIHCRECGYLGAAQR